MGASCLDAHLSALSNAEATDRVDQEDVMKHRRPSDSTPPNGYEAVRLDVTPDELWRMYIGTRAELSATKSALRQAEAANLKARETERVLRGEIALLTQARADDGLDFDGLLSQVTHQAFAAYVVSDTRGQVIYGNMAAEALFGDVTGAPVFRTVLERLSRRVAPPPDEQSGVNVNPMRFGYGFWERVVIREETACLQERVLLHPPAEDGAKRDVHFVIKTIEHRGRRYVALEITDIEAILKDKLSGLFLQDVGLNALDREIARLTREPELVETQPLSFVFFDVDGFKRFNEEHGYDAGDRVIREIAKVIMDLIRSTDLACRWFSGDEFGIVVRSGNAMKLAVRIQQAIEEIAILWPRGSGGKAILTVRVTTGVATWNPGETREELVERAKGYAKKTPANKGRVTGELRVEDIAGQAGVGTPPHRRKA